MSNQLKKTKFFPIWQEDKEMAWLQSMSKQGWHLYKKGYTTYWFEKGEKTDYIYNVDYKSTFNSDMDEYKSIYNDAGWEYVDGYAGWHYFRVPKDSKSKAIYSNVESKKRRLKKIITLLLSVAGANISIIFMNLLVNWVGFEKISAIPIILFILWGMSALVVLLLALTSIRLLFEMRKLNKTIEE